ncbi:MAG: radical SAM protein [Candidatus Omnitrophota bacterium]|nr:radical SAM protein [Candidatus Omnitrophota bacterium]
MAKISAMKEIQYKTFSLRTHKKNWRIKRSNVCQFELTFKCGLNCSYCYVSCYNKPECIKNELTTKGVKFILDKVYNAGIIWLCLTGGDPLTREDFLEIYSYAKNKGLIITIFTNGYSMTKEIADYLEKRPPFVKEACF